MTSKRYWLWLSLSILTVAVTITTLTLLKGAGKTALAQEGNSNFEELQEAIENQPPGDTVITSGEAGQFGPQSDGSGIEVISSAAFRNDGDNPNGWVHWFANGYLRNNSSQLACFMAPTYPPAGATLTRFSITMRDANGAEDLGVVLYRVPLANSGPSEVLAVAFPQNLNNPNVIEASDLTIEPGKALVSNAYAYYAAFCFPGSTSQTILFYGARLFYNPAP